MSIAGSEQDWLQGFFPGAGRPLQELYQKAVDAAGLLPVDLYGIRDLLELSDYQADEPLHVLLLAMTLALNEGSLCVQAIPSAIRGRLEDLTEPEQTARWAEQALDRLAAGNYHRLISSRMDDEHPVIHHQEKGRP